MATRDAETTTLKHRVSFNSQTKETECSELQNDHEPFFNRLHTLDVELSRKLSFCAEKGSSGWRSVLIALEISGHGVPWILGTLLAIYSFRDHQQQFACNFLLALLLDLAVVGLTKFTFKRKRPVYNEKDMFVTVSVDKFSFPSGHSTRAAMVAALFGLVMSCRLCRLLVTAWATCVAVSRVVLGRHHVSDVVFGAVIGVAQYWVMIRMWLPLMTCQRILDLVPFVELLQ